MDSWSVVILPQPPARRAQGTPIEACWDRACPRIQMGLQRRGVAALGERWAWRGVAWQALRGEGLVTLVSLKSCHMVILKTSFRFELKQLNVIYP